MSAYVYNSLRDVLHILSDHKNIRWHHFNSMSCVCHCVLIQSIQRFNDQMQHAKHIDHHFTGFNVKYRFMLNKDCHFEFYYRKWMSFMFALYTIHPTHTLYTIHPLAHLSRFFANCWHFHTKYAEDVSFYDAVTNTIRDIFNHWKELFQHIVDLVKLISRFGTNNGVVV